MKKTSELKEYMKRNIFFLLMIILIILVLGIFFVGLIRIKSSTITHIALSPIERRFQKKIEFSTSRIWLPTNIFLEGVTITDKTGRLYYINTVDLHYNLIELLFKKREFFFVLKDIKLYQHMRLLDSVADMLVISTMPDVEFKGIEGVLQLHKSATFIKNVYAHNDRMRIRGSGWIDNNGSLDCNVSFSFSKDVTDIVPDVVKAALLKYEGDEWMGIAFGVKGNYKKPSLYITGDTLKLNIMEEILKDE